MLTHVCNTNLDGGSSQLLQSGLPYYLLLLFTVQLLLIGTDDGNFNYPYKYASLVGKSLSFWNSNGGGVNQ